MVWTPRWPESAAIAVTAMVLAAAGGALQRATRATWASRDQLHLYLLGLAWPADLAGLAYAAVAGSTSGGTIAGRLGVVAGAAAALVAVLPWATEADRRSVRAANAAIVTVLAAVTGAAGGWIDAWRRPELVLSGTCLLGSLLLWLSTPRLQDLRSPSPRLDLASVVGVATSHFIFAMGVTLLVISLMVLVGPSR